MSEPRSPAAASGDRFALQTVHVNDRLDELPDAQPDTYGVDPLRLIENTVDGGASAVQLEGRGLTQCLDDVGEIHRYPPFHAAWRSPVGGNPPIRSVATDLGAAAQRMNSRLTARKMSVPASRNHSKATISRETISAP